MTAEVSKANTDTPGELFCLDAIQSQGVLRQLQLNPLDQGLANRTVNYVDRVTPMINDLIKIEVRHYPDAMVSMFATRGP